MATLYSTLPQRYVYDFNTAFEVAMSQEKVSKLVPFTIPADFVGEYMAVNRRGRAKAKERPADARFQAVELENFAWDRRWVARRYFDIEYGIDALDLDKMPISPQSGMIQEAVKAMNRVRDQVIYDGAFADVKQGQNPVSATTITAAADGVVTISATGGFGLDTLLELKKRMIDSAVITDADAKVLITIDGQRNTDLLSETQLTSIDYAMRKPLAEGRIWEALGFVLIPFASNTDDPLLKPSGGTRSLLVMAEGAVVFVGGAVNIQIKDRPDLKDVTQIRVTMAANAVRVEGSKVLKVTVTA